MYFVLPGHTRLKGLTYFLITAEPLVYIALWGTAVINHKDQKRYEALLNYLTMTNVVPIATWSLLKHNTRCFVSLKWILFNNLRCPHEQNNRHSPIIKNGSLLKQGMNNNGSLAQFLQKLCTFFSFYHLILTPMLFTVLLVTICRYIQ